MAVTGVAGRFVSQQLPEWQALLRAQADRFSAKRAQSKSSLEQFVFWLLEFSCRFLAGLVAGTLAGYSSHLVLDFFTPMSLPLI
jgi:hypothetical protein